MFTSLRPFPPYHFLSKYSSYILDSPHYPSEPVNSHVVKMHYRFLQITHPFYFFFLTFSFESRFLFYIFFYTQIYTSFWNRSVFAEISPDRSSMLPFVSTLPSLCIAIIHISKWPVSSKRPFHPIMFLSRNFWFISFTNLACLLLFCF